MSLLNGFGEGKNPLLECPLQDIFVDIFKKINNNNTYRSIQNATSHVFYFRIIFYEDYFNPFVWAQPFLRVVPLWSF